MPSAGVSIGGALGTGLRGVAELVLEKGLLPAGRLEALLRPEVLAGTGGPQGS